MAEEAAAPPNACLAIPRSRVMSADVSSDIRRIVTVCSQAFDVTAFGNHTLLKARLLLPLVYDEWVWSASTRWAR